MGGGKGGGGGGGNAKAGSVNAQPSVDLLYEGRDEAIDLYYKAVSQAVYALPYAFQAYRTQLNNATRAALTGFAEAENISAPFAQSATDAMQELRGFLGMAPASEAGNVRNTIESFAQQLRAPGISYLQNTDKYFTEMSADLNNIDKISDVEQRAEMKGNVKNKLDFFNRAAYYDTTKSEVLGALLGMKQYEGLTPDAENPAPTIRTADFNKLTQEEKEFLGIADREFKYEEAPEGISGEYITLQLMRENQDFARTGKVAFLMNGYIPIELNTDIRKKLEPEAFDKLKKINVRGGIAATGTTALFTKSGQFMAGSNEDRKKLAEMDREAAKDLLSGEEASQIESSLYTPESSVVINTKALQYAAGWDQLGAKNQKAVKDYLDQIGPTEQSEEFFKKAGVNLGTGTRTHDQIPLQEAHSIDWVRQRIAQLKELDPDGDILASYPEGISGLSNAAYEGNLNANDYIESKYALEDIADQSKVLAADVDVFITDEQLQPMSAEEIQTKVESTPGFQTQMHTRMQALERLATRQGKLKSGNAMAAASDLGAGLSSQYFNQHVGSLAGMAGLYLPSAGVASGQAAQTGAISQQAFTDMGQAQSGAIESISGARQTGFQQAAGTTYAAASQAANMTLQAAITNAQLQTQASIANAQMSAMSGGGGGGGIGSALGSIIGAFF